jgi:hypothetical protein
MNFDTLQRLADRRGIRIASRPAGLGISVLGFLVTFVPAGGLSGFSALPQAVVYGLLSAASAFALWLWACQPPKAPSGTIGVAFAISAEGEHERRLLRADLLQEITQLLEHTPSTLRIKVLTVPDYLAPDVSDRESANKMRKRCRAQLLVWGAIRTRGHAGKETLVLRLEGHVSHRPTAIERSNALGREMRSLIPATTEIELGNELRGLETTSQNLAVATKFVLALAFAVSDDWKSAKKTLLELLRQHIGNDGKRPKKAVGRGRSARDWRQSLTKHLSAVSFADYCAEMEAWDQNRNEKQHLISAEAALNDYRKFLGNSEGQSDLKYLVAKANLEVSIRKNYLEAKRLLNRCRTLAIHDPTWRMSMAFIDAVVGDLDSALDLYDAASGLTPDVRTVVSVEQYVQWWLQENSGPPGLHLLSAILNCDLKTDAALARQDLDSFIAKSPQSLSPKVTRRVKELSERLHITFGEHARTETSS